MLPDFIGESLQGKKVVFIPTAWSYAKSDKEQAGHDFINSLDRQALENLGFVVKDLEILNATAFEI